MLISWRNRPPQNFFGSFPQEIGRHKTFRHISSGNRPPQNFSAYFLEESAATKLFRLISLRNRPPQNFFGSFPQEIGRHKTFRLISSGNRPLTCSLISSGNRPLTYSLISSGNRWMGFHSFPQEIDGWSSTHFLRKSLDDLHRTHVKLSAESGVRVAESCWCRVRVVC